MKRAFEGKAMIDDKLFRAWNNYGKNRIYICSEDEKKTYGYIDLDNANELVCDHDLKYTLKPYVEKFKEIYDF